ncbi:MAG: cadherin-like beta sandwich domain-containing protein [Clostridia bacterium]|nr:cadherin-like beta sandwich domain-containing protein [Clostridia bacterium]
MVYDRKKRLVKAMFSLVVFIMFAITSNIYGASVNFTATNTTLEIGGTSTITISGSELVGRFNITSSNSSIVSLSTSSVFVDNPVTVTATAKAAGTVTITLTPADVADTTAEANDITSTIGTKSITIKVNEKQNTNTNNNNNNGGTTTVSNNANLKKLVPDHEGLSPNFSSGTTKYSLTVPSSVTNLGLTVATEDSGAKYSISGNNDLKQGDNIVTITVTAKNGSKKVYTITVTKADDPQKANAYLNSIVVDGKVLSPEFNSETLNYTIDSVAANITKLTVLAYQKNDKAKVTITGNDPLIDGENTIKISVVAEDGVTTKEYTIKVVRDKSVKIDEGKVEDVFNNYVDIYGNSNKESNRISNVYNDFVSTIKNNALVLALFFFILVEFGQIVYLYKKLKKNPVEEEAENENLNSEEEIVEDEQKATTTRRNRNND